LKGTCLGKGKAQVRCKNKLQSNTLLEKLYKKGVNFTVKGKKDSQGNSKAKPKYGLNTRRADEVKRNQFMEEMRREEARL